MADPYLGEIILVAGNFAPQNYMSCAGQLLPTDQNTSLYALIGTTYGGNDDAFALPDLRSRVAIGQGQGPTLGNYVLGQNGGAETHTLTAAEMAAHSHTVAVTSSTDSTVNTKTPSDKTYIAAETLSADNKSYAYAPYKGSEGVSLAIQSVSPSTDGGLPHENRQPVLAMIYCIALSGIFPHQN